MRKIITLILFVMTAVSLAACGSKKISTSDPADAASSEQEKKKTTEKDSGAEKYEVGDIILADGSVVKEKDFSDVDRENLPIAVVADIKSDGTALGLGVHRSSDPMQWALEKTTGEQTKFTKLVCAKEDSDSEDADELDFTGATDGGDSWNTICSGDKKGTKNAKKNYPAFHFVNTYAKTHKLTGSYASGWYLPSIAETCVVYRNKEVIDRSLQKIYESDHTAAMDGLETNWYWSSSQSGTKKDYAWFVHYVNGYVSDCPKNFTNLHVLAVRKF